MLEIKGLETFYGGIQALKGIDLKIGAGEIITLIGANGAGKSTVLMSISGVVKPRSGGICFMDETITGLDPDRIFSRGIVQVPEGRRIFAELSVMENLEMGAYLRSDKAGIKKDLEYIFTVFPRLAERRNQPGGTLSGGEQQMLAISRGLMGKPKLLLLDEPSLGLAPVLVQQIFETIKKINAEQGVTIFLVEQNANMALGLADRGYVMETGRITLEGPSKTLLCDDRVRSAYLGL